MRCLILSCFAGRNWVSRVRATAPEFGVFEICGLTYIQSCAVASVSCYTLSVRHTHLLITSQGEGKPTGVN